MQSRLVGFVGGGRITAIFLHALGGRGLALDRVTVSDASAEVLAKLKGRFPEIAVTVGNDEAAPCVRSSTRGSPPSRSRTSCR